MIFDNNTAYQIYRCLITLHRVLIKSSKHLENKGFIAVCPPYPFIRFHLRLCFPRYLIRAKIREEKSDNKL